MDLLMLILSALLLAVDFLIAGVYQKREGTSPEKVFRFNFFIGLFKTVIFFFLNGCRMEFTVFSGTMALGMTVLVILYTLIGFQILAAGNTAYYSFFLMTGGMMIPYLWGLLFLNEPFSWWTMAGLFLITGAAFVIYSDKKKISAHIVICCAAIFVLNGFVSVISKEHQIRAGAVSSSGYVLLTAMAQMLLSGGGLLCYRFFSKDREAQKKADRKSVGLLGAYALCSGLAYLMQLNSAARLPATVVYPVVTGGSIVFTVGAGWALIREKPSKALLLGMAICLVGTCLFV